MKIKIGDQRGQGLVEYALIIALVTIVAYIAVCIILGIVTGVNYFILTTNILGNPLGIILIIPVSYWLVTTVIKNISESRKK